MKKLSRKILWFTIVFLTVVVWLQIFASWEKDDYIAKLDACIDNQIEENRKIKKELHETTVRAAKLAEDLEKVGNKGSK